MILLGGSETRYPDVHAAAGEWASQRIFNLSGAFERFCSFVVMDDEQIIAAILLHNFDPHAGVVEISAAGSGRWQSRRVIREVFSAAFDRLGCQMIVMRGDEDNHRMIENSRKLGCAEHFIPRLGGRDKGQWIFTLTDDDWRTSRLNKR